MFRKPKAKGSTRQRTSGWDENAEIGSEKKSEDPLKKTSIDAYVDDDDEDISTAPVSKPPRSLLSFDDDEGNDAEFKVKKNKKHLKELKRQKMLEEKADEIKKEIKEEPGDEDGLNLVVKPHEPIREKKGRDEGKKADFLERYRSRNREDELYSSGTVGSDRHERREEEEEVERDEVANKFPSAFGGIPDSKAVYEARKRRERMRKEGTDGGYIPLDDDQKIRCKGERGRLIREDDNDDSDEDAGKFYSSKALLEDEEQRRRGQHDEFLAHEQGDDSEDEETRRERVQWERERIARAVGKEKIGALRQEYNQQAQLFRGRQDEYLQGGGEEEMDMDMDVEEVHRTAPSDVSHVTMEDIMSKLKLRLNDRDEALNSRRHEQTKIQQQIEENKTSLSAMQSQVPLLADKLTMYQETRVFIRSLLECLNEKVPDINGLVDAARRLRKARCERLQRRRRRDIRDQYDECAAVAAGKPASTVRHGEMATRAAEREGRRARRRLAREKTLSGVAHEDGMSSDEEETTSQTMADQQAYDEVQSGVETVFVDALDEYAQLDKVLDRMVDWLAVDGRSFEDAYVQLCIPKLASPYVRLEMAGRQLLAEKDFELSSLKWYSACLMAGSRHSEVDREHPVLVGIVPAVCEKTLLALLTDVVAEEWDPMSTSESRRLGGLISQLIRDMPTMTEKSKPLGRLLQAVTDKIQVSVDEDLFVPMFSRQCVDQSSSGCRAFLDRQFWSSIKLLRNIGFFEGALSTMTRVHLQLHGVASRFSSLALQLGGCGGLAVAGKTRALLSALPREWREMGTEQGVNWRPVINVLKKISDEQTDSNKELCREVRKAIEEIEKQ